MTQTLTTETVNALNDKACAALDRLSREMVACARRNYLDSSFVEIRSVVAELLDALCEVANREAQPVAVEAITEIMEQEWGEWCADAGNFPDDFEWQGGNGILSYEPGRWSRRVANRIINLTAPPAPAVNILDEVSCEGFNPKDWVEARNLGQCEGWNACRAAMLAAAPEGGN